MQPKSLQAAIDEAGSPIDLVWKPHAPAWRVPVIEPEYAGWREEQLAWRNAVALSDLSHHMWDLWIEGPDALKLLMDYSANNYENFAIGQAKQFVPVTREGHLVTDGIVMRDGEERFNLSGVPASQSWVRYHGEKGRYDVEFTVDPDSGLRKSGDPLIFRFQLQGPQALALTEKIFGGPLPKTKFFHSTPVQLEGRQFRAFRHGMAGMPGYEFIGRWEDAAFVKAAMLKAGEEFGLVHVGGKAYYTNGIESGWIPTPTPGIFTDPELAGYREWLSVFSYEGQKPLHGSFFSSNIEDYYVSPFELGYGKSIAFNHDFYGRDALQAAQGKTPRTRVTFVYNQDEVRAAMGDLDYFNNYARYRVEAGGKLVGLTFQTGKIGPIDSLLSLGLVDHACATPGTQVEIVIGEHLGSAAGVNSGSDFKRIRATVAASPFNDHAREAYRRN
ncbi:aminomethyl transferase family protein [Novosphingobium sp. SG720]|uniref:aminomethyl transferase family protein n=1 Tax=Novosphingobium sp. SG720 TaxID=2586998 RepID=UPI0014452758|nr:aminomethyl transferase family protein [Novosphingobium sp. SG720]NKJ44516.1 vanillate/3-O-methylgallate O-demethylase [Novosphingobium sp. SG720]